MTGPEHDESLGQFLDGLAAAGASDTALIHDDRHFSYSELAEASRRVATGLAEAGVGSGDRVAIWLPNIPEWPILYFACARIGAIAVAVNTRYRSSEVGDIVGRSGCRVLALWPDFHNIDFAGILADVDPGALDAVEQVLVCRQPDAEVTELLPGRSHTRFETLAAYAPLPRDEGGAQSPCTLFTTSGTTSAPKFVLHQQSVICHHARQAALGHGYTTPDAALLQILPLCGTFGLTQLLAGLAAGKMNVLQTMFDATEAVALGQRHEITHFCASDEMIARMLDAADEPIPFPALHFCGFARFSGISGLIERARERGVIMRGVYGMSECQALFSLQPDEPERRAHGGGIPVSAQARVRAVDPDNGQVLEHSVVGELQLQAPSLMLGYFDNPQATASAYTEDGYFRTGDMGYTLADGGFVFTTRAGDALRLGGFMVAPAEIEAYLERHPSVQACAVVAGAGAHAQRAIAFACGEAGADIDEAALMAFCREGLAGFKVPARIFVLDAFPTVASANGVKIRRNVLREWADEWTRVD